MALALSNEEEKKRKPYTMSRAAREQRRQAGKKHGLFARAAPNLRGRSMRVTFLVSRAFEVLPDLDQRDESVVRSWARGECMSADFFARLEADPTNEKLFNAWARAENLLAERRKELFMTPASRLAAAKLAKDLRDGREDVADALADLRKRHHAALEAASE